MPPPAKQPGVLPIVIDLTMDDDAESQVPPLSPSAYSPLIKAEPDTQDGFLAEKFPLPELPSSAMDDSTDVDDNSTQINEELDIDMVSMLERYDANASTWRSSVVDIEYANSLAALEQKQMVIAMKESRNEDVTTDMVECEALRQAVHVAAKGKKKAQDFEKEQSEDNNIFLADSEHSNEDDVSITPVPSRAEAMNLIKREAEVSISDDEGGPPSLSKKATPKAARKPRITKKTAATRGKTRASKSSNAGSRGGRRQQKVGMLNVGSLIRNNIVAGAKANQGQPAPPTFIGERTKKGALNALMESIPLEQRSTARSTRSQLDDACKQFRWHGNRSMRADGLEGWKLKGMVSSLKHFQLLSAAWGVKQERRPSAPFGGILADTMGYGKTVQMISIMVENRPLATAQNQTTLIVVPSSLVTQWMEEIKKHTEDGILDGVCVYKAGSGLFSLDVCNALRKYQIVITTYHEVTQNYSKCEPPLHIAKEKKKDIWWNTYYEKNKGPLLRIRFHRIILDEAQFIKNHESQRSKACRLLTAKQKWVLTGTPLSNCMEELFPYFNFLGVDGSGTYAQFKSNYAKRNDVTTERLDAILRSVMVRRTGTDRMFGAPLVSLPDLDYETVPVKFSPIEHAIYTVVRKRFTAKINDWSTSGKIKRMSNNIFVMILRLRQMCAHVLMIASTIRNLLEVQDVAKLWKVTKRHSSIMNNGTGNRTAKLLEQILLEAQSEESEGKETPPEATSSSPGATADVMTGDAEFDHRELFHRLQNSGTWEKIRQRSLCTVCREVPEDYRAKMAVPCGHLYCEDCVNVLLESAQQAGVEAECTECHIEITGSADMIAMESVASAANHIPRQRPSPHEAAQKRKQDKLNEKLDLKWISTPGCEGLSSKILSVTTMMQKWIREDPEAKIVVFTLFVPIVKLLGNVCAKRGWGYAEYTGQTKPDARAQVLKEWRDPAQEQKVLLMSMQAGGLGLNLVEASYVIIVDPWWNAAAEDQAFSRIYRIGQMRNCIVRRFVIEDAIDTQLMLKLQRDKTKECDRVIDGRPDVDLSVPDLLRLFGPTKRDPVTGEIIEDGEEADAVDEFIQGDEVVIEDSDGEEMMPAPARPREA